MSFLHFRVQGTAGRGRRLRHRMNGRAAMSTARRVRRHSRIWSFPADPSETSSRSVMSRMQSRATRSSGWLTEDRPASWAPVVSSKPTTPTSSPGGRPRRVSSASTASASTSEAQTTAVTSGSSNSDPAAARPSTRSLCERAIGPGPRDRRRTAPGFQPASRSSPTPGPAGQPRNPMTAVALAEQVLGCSRRARQHRLRPPRGGDRTSPRACRRSRRGRPVRQGGTCAGRPGGWT